jgi:Dolichyl-phosphate-mannose-protein mannosyltransferase
VRKRLTRLLAALERLAGHPLGAVALFASALAVWVIQAQGWPLVPGGNLDEYLYSYIQLFDGHPLLPWSLEFRTPVTGLVTGAALDTAGGRFAQPLVAVFYAGSIVLWSAAALHFGRRAALAMAAAMLVYPGYAGMFHEFGAEMVLGLAFAGWAFLLCRALSKPSIGRFVAVGLGIALLALIRPGNAVVVALALCPLLLRDSWRRRFTYAAAAVVAAIVPLLGWTLHNGLIVGDYTFARGVNAIVPFYRAYVTDHVVGPDNGPSSRRLAAAIERDLVTKEPFTSYRVTADKLFARPSFRVHEDLMVFSDEEWGWDSAYSTLRGAALEGIRKHPGAYASGVLHTLFHELYADFYFRLAGGFPQPSTPSTIVVNGRRLEAPSEGQIIPAGQSIWISTPDNRIQQVWTSSSRYHFVFTHPADRLRFERMTRRLDALFGALPHRDRSPEVALRFTQLSRWFPRPLIWLAIGLVALLVRRPRNSLALIVTALAALLVVGMTALGLPVEMHYVLPVAPALVFLAVCALLGPRARGLDGRSPAEVG